MRTNYTERGGKEKKNLPNDNWPKKDLIFHFFKNKPTNAHTRACMRERERVSKSSCVVTRLWTS